MSYTSSEVKMRYNTKTYHPVGVRFRLVEDADIIDFINENKDEIGTTQLFREALEYYIKEKGED